MRSTEFTLCFTFFHFLYLSRIILYCAKHVHLLCKVEVQRKAIPGLKLQKQAYNVCLLFLKAKIFNGAYTELNKMQEGEQLQKYHHDNYSH